jgi:hypothetical protein
MKKVALIITTLLMGGCITDAEFHRMMLQEAAHNHPYQDSLRDYGSAISLIQGQEQLLRIQQGMEMGRGWVELR